MLIKIVHALRMARGTNAKLAILKKHSDNNKWKKFLTYTYDERITYGVSAPNGCTDFEEVVINDKMFKALDALSTRKITGKRARALAKALSRDFGEIPRLVLGRSIKAGVSYNTINKAYPGLIAVFKSMKGKDCPITEWPVASSIKYDGVKVFAFVSIESEVVLTTSSGASFNLKSLQRELLLADPGVYEGELIHKEGKMIHRPVITGQLNSLLAGTIDDISNYSFMVYDYIPIEEWASQQATTSFIERQNLLADSLASFGHNIEFVKVVHHHLLKNMEKVVLFYEHYQSLGYEGSMHRYIYDRYRWDRSERLIKKKAIRECKLTCIGVVPHSNPSKGNIGSLVCKGTITDKDAGTVDVSVKVGSGLSKYDIQFDESRYVGKEVEVIYNSVTKTDAGYSLFLPRYKRLAGDRNV
jgi:ATP-dependent DNA ligase